MKPIKMMVSTNDMPRTRRPSVRRGYSLLEALLAFFVFATAILYLGVASNFAIRAGTRSHLETRAGLLARSRMAELRSWLQQATPNQFAVWNTYPNLGTWQADAGGMESRVDLLLHQTYSPSFASEIFLPAVDRRAFDQSLLRARVEVRWGSNQSCRLVSLISDSHRDWRAANPIVVSPVGGPSFPLAQGASAQFEAVAYDAGGQVIPDMTFSWAVVPGTSCCLLESQRPDGHQATVRHHMPKVPGPGFDFAPPGEVWVQATARYWGQERSGRFVLGLQ
jgi:hypothetical protein